MKTLRDLEVADALYLGDAGPEAVVGDQVKLFLDQEANPDFPAFIYGIIQHPIVKVDCGSKTSYVIEYDEADLEGAASLIRPGDVIDYTVESGIQASISAETAARVAGDALKLNLSDVTVTPTADKVVRRSDTGAISATAMDIDGIQFISDDGDGYPQISIGSIVIKASNASITGAHFIPPTSDPVLAGAIWNNAGTLAISAG